MKDHIKGLLIVPTTSLVEQMFTDFKSYGFDSDKYCHRQYSGKEKHTNSFLTISTWQSVYKNDKGYFEQFDFVIGDEAHQFKAKSLTTILSNCINSKYRIGTTGTLDGTQTHRLVLEGLFGPVYKATTTSELIERGQLADFRIKCLILKYDDKALTALDPTPFKPTDFWNASESYFAPVFIFAAQSISLPNGIPLP